MTPGPTPFDSLTLTRSAGLRADAGKLHDMLDKYGIANTFEIYPGTHTSKVADRFQNHVMKFIGATLSFEASRR